MTPVALASLAAVAALLVPFFESLVLLLRPDRESRTPALVLLTCGLAISAQALGLAAGIPDDFTLSQFVRMAATFTAALVFVDALKR